jgi:hypothetical protein
MAYGIQVMGADGTVGLQIDARLPRIIAATYVYIGGANNAAYLGGAYYSAIAIDTVIADTKELSVNVSYYDQQPDYIKGWHFSVSKLNSAGQWYAIINIVGYPGYYDVYGNFYGNYFPAQYININLVAW